MSHHEHRYRAAVPGDGWTAQTIPRDYDEELDKLVGPYRPEGGPRTVDIHVRRLRAKLGDALPLETVRGSGYKLRAPDTEDNKGRGGNADRGERPERLDPEEQEEVEEEAG